MTSHDTNMICEFESMHQESNAISILNICIYIENSPHSAIKNDTDQMNVPQTF